jgi:hypothetical protein
MKTRWHSIFLGLVLMWFWIPAQASNFDFLDKTAPIRAFTKEDVAMMQDAINKALDGTKDGDKLAWKNDETGNAGLIQPLRTHEAGGQLCREVRIVTRSKDQVSQSRWTFCKIGDNWQMSNEPLEPKSAGE